MNKNSNWPYKKCMVVCVGFWVMGMGLKFLPLIFAGIAISYIGLAFIDNMDDGEE